jgi:hypothetical protein
MITLLLHIANSQPIKVDVDEMPDPRDAVIFPWWRINYVQVLPSLEDEVEFPLPFRD